MSSIDYHLEELEIAINSERKEHILPEILQNYHVILDIGCGIGQSFIALNCLDRKCIGIDIDEEAISYGISNYGDKIDYRVSDSLTLPCQDDSVDFVFSRAAIPYTNIPKVLLEIKRVLKPNGHIWLSIFDKNYSKRKLRQAIKNKNIKEAIHKLYILFNGYLFKYFGFLIPFINGTYESWQDPDAMLKILSKNGFEAETQLQNGHLIILGKLQDGAD
ncbi:MAG: class I SAM-dependent methyltransferase [Kordiimonadaceae bacterium]|nr:class I SAM-dependent methyltransferase [Kordiimonadaceae bacterium]